MAELIDFERLDYVPDADTLRLSRHAMSQASFEKLVADFRALALGSAIIVTPDPSIYTRRVQEAIERAAYLFDEQMLRRPIHLESLVTQGVSKARGQLAHQLRKILEPVADQLGCHAVTRCLDDGRVAVVKLHRSMPRNAITLSGTGRNHGKPGGSR